MALKFLTKCVLGSALYLCQIEAMAMDTHSDKTLIEQAADQTLLGRLPKELRDHITQNHIDFDEKLKRQARINQIVGIMSFDKIENLADLNSLGHQPGEEKIPGATEEDVAAAKLEYKRKLQEHMKAGYSKEATEFFLMSEYIKMSHRISKIIHYMRSHVINNLDDLNKLSDVPGEETVPGATEEDVAAARLEHENDVRQK